LDERWFKRNLQDAPFEKLSDEDSAEEWDVNGNDAEYEGHLTNG
jgi:hypothetical protein